ncbi:MAG: PDZ domain-containing protein, partial [Vicinamibacterales bacterium]
GFTPEQFRATAEEVAGRDLSAWFVTVLETTAELDYTEALDWFGLELTGAPTEHGRAWLGLVTRADGNRLLVSQARRETPAYEAGFDVSDEIVAIGNYRVTAQEWSQRLQQHRPGETVSILVSRRGRLKRLDATFAAEPVSPWRLALLPNATTAQVSHLNAWLDPQ